MIRFLRALPPFLALLLLGAHFFRAGSPILVAASLACLVLLFVPRNWAAWALRAILVLGAAEWLRTAARFAAERAAVGEPATRLWVILGAVAAFTLLAAWSVPPRRGE